MCLLCVRCNNLVVLLSNNNSLNATKNCVFRNSMTNILIKGVIKKEFDEIIYSEFENFVIPSICFEIATPRRQSSSQ